MKDVYHVIKPVPLQNRRTRGRLILARQRNKASNFATRKLALGKTSGRACRKAIGPEDGNRETSVRRLLDHMHCGAENVNQTKAQDKQ